MNIITEVKNALRSKNVNYIEGENNNSYVLEVAVERNFEFIDIILLKKYIEIFKKALRYEVKRYRNDGILAETRVITSEELKSYTEISLCIESKIRRSEKGYKFIIILDKEIYLKNLSANIELEKHLILTEKFYEKAEILNNNNNNIYILPEDIYIYNEYNLITSINRNYVEDIEIFQRNYKSVECEELKGKYENFIESVVIYENVNYIQPNLLNFDFEQSDFKFTKKIRDVIILQNIKMIMISLNNYTKNINGINIYSISGSKKLDVEDYFEIGKIKLVDYKKLYEVYDFVYQNNVKMKDKVLLARNIITNLISAKWIKGCQNKKETLELVISNSEWILNSLIDSYDKVINDDVSTFFERKKEFIKSLNEELQENNKDLDNLTNNINKILITSIASTIAASVGYIAKEDITMIKIIAAIYGLYLIINTIINLPIIGIRKYVISDKFDVLKAKYKKECLKEEEIDSEFSNIEKTNKKYNVIFWVNSVIFSALFLTLIIFLYKIAFDNNFIENLAKQFSK